MAGPRILVVEDEFLVRLILVETLGDAGYDAAEAADGEEAVRLLDGDGYDLLVTDVHMPGRLDGVSVARHARERFPGMPVVFATARPDSVRGFGKLGERDALVPKPYGTEEMLRVVRRVLAQGSGG